MFGNLAEMAKMLQKAKDIQGNLKKFKEEMAQAEYTSSACGNSVQVTVSGDFRVKQVLISESASADRQGLQAEITQATNQALDLAKAAAQSKMAEITGGLGLDLPGIF